MFWWLFSEEPKYERQYHTNQNARHNGKVETEVVAFVVDIARKTAQPATAKAAPDQSANGGDHQTGDD
jgi:hypothetical protein